MDIKEKLQVFSEKLGESLTISLTENGALLCAAGAAGAVAPSQMWMDGYWSDGGGSWDHNAWSDRW